MSKQEETLLEPTEEIEENSEIEDEESMVDDLDLEMPDDYDVFEDEEDEPYMMDMGGLLSSVLATEEGDTVCSALVNISRQMEVQNKILIKMLSQMQKKST